MMALMRVSILTMIIFSVSTLMPLGLWEHEWATHGTCINTLDPSCYTGYQTGEEAADFYETVVNLFQTLPSYTVSNYFLSSRLYSLTVFPS
jgi:ribonuclease I